MTKQFEARGAAGKHSTIFATKLQAVAFAMSLFGMTVMPAHAAPAGCALGNAAEQRILDEARVHMAAGQFDLSVATMSRIGKRDGNQSQSCLWLEAQVLTGENLMASGKHGDAYTVLTAAYKVSAGANEQRARIAGALAKATYLHALAVQPDRIDEPESSVEARRLASVTALYEESIRLAGMAGLPDVEAAALQNLASMRQRSGDQAAAEATLARAETAARRTGESLLLAGVMITRLEWRAMKSVLEATEVEEVARVVRRLAPSAAKADLLIRLAGTQQTSGGNAALAGSLLEEARVASADAGYAAGLSSAYGGLGHLAELAGDVPLAERRTNQALESLLSLDAPELAYQWYWQLGRIHRLKGAQREALAGLTRAVQQVSRIRSDISQDQRTRRLSYRGVAGELYRDLVDLRLQMTPSPSDAAAYKEWLTVTRSLLEQLKTAELQDYYGDDCVTALRRKERKVDDVLKDSDAAAIYPVILKDRLEILVTKPDGSIMRANPVAISEKLLVDVVRELRSGLENATEDFYLPPARRLYDVIMRPVLPMLGKDIRTLVFIPDGALRTVPLSVLNDGGAGASGFLVNRFAVAYAPALELLDDDDVAGSAAKTGPRKISLLSAGLTEAVAGFKKLDAVSSELDFIRQDKNFQSSELRNASFTVEGITARLKAAPYTIIHMATHGEFGDDPARTFLLTYKGKMSLNILEGLIKLSRFRSNPVELLFLSACKTAKGKGDDDRKALGLAGIAVKSGARAAVATLWSADDEASSDLVKAFYTRLQGGGVTKAEALRQAQVELMSQPRQHPVLWAPYLLIGKWK